MGVVGSLITQVAHGTRSVLGQVGLGPKDPNPFLKKKIARSNYKDVWNFVSKSESQAKYAVSGHDDEEIYARSAQATLETIARDVGLGPDDVVLEIGAGVGRVGAAMAPRCREWIGTDVSDNMVGHIRRRLAGHANVKGVTTNGYDLDVIATESIDLVYCTVVFMHLEEFERYRYVRESFRILRPGGRLYVDNTNLLSPEGWAFFQQHVEMPGYRRPPHISKPSTPQELKCYFEHAGFTAINQAEAGLFISTYGWKPQLLPG